MENYALQFIAENLHDPKQRYIIEYLFSNMNADELKAAKQMFSDNWIASRIEKRAEALERHKYGNMSFNSLLRLYSNPKSKKRAIAREYLKYRFSYLAAKEKLRLIKAFIEGSKGDRKWACSHMCEYWDDKFLPAVTQFWETEQHITAALLLIKHAPLDYVRQNAEKFPPIFITSLSFRLKDDPTYTVPLDDVDTDKYLHAMAICGKTMDYETAKDALYEIYMENVEYFVNRNRADGFLRCSYNIHNSEVLWKALQHLQRLGQHRLVIDVFHMFYNILDLFNQNTDDRDRDTDQAADYFVDIAEYVAYLAFNDDFEKLHNGEQYTLSEEDALPEDETDEDENAESENALTLSEKTEILEQMSANSKAFKNLTDTLDLAPF